jgi:hypothetical protein
VLARQRVVLSLTPLIEIIFSSSAHTEQDRTCPACGHLIPADPAEEKAAHGSVAAFKINES